MNNSKSEYPDTTIVNPLRVPDKEILRLANGLIARGIAFSFRRLYGGYQIIAADQTWDVICHEFSYGGNLGLLEVMGKYAEQVGDDVEGYLTADEIFARMEKKS